MDRFIWNDGETKNVSDKIQCRNCINRLSGENGYSKARCAIYSKENGLRKPISILFNNEKCKYYKKDE